MTSSLQEPLQTPHVAVLDEARAAYRRGDWSVAYAAFVRADSVGPMGYDDVDAYAG